MSHKQGLDISSLCPDSLLQAINDSNKRLIAAVTEKKEAYKTKDRKRNHLERIEKSLQRPLTDVFNRWTSERPSDCLQLAVGTLAAIERAVALSPHLTLDEISIALNTAVNGPDTTADQLGKKPSQSRIQAVCHRLETNSIRTPIDSNAREINPRLQRFLRQKRQASPSPSTPASKRQFTSTHDSPSPEQARHAVTPLSDRSSHRHLSGGSLDEDNENAGAHDSWDDIAGLSESDSPFNLVDGEDADIQDPTHLLVTSDLENSLRDPFSERFAACKRKTGTDDLITPPSSRHSSTVRFAPFPETDATRHFSAAQTMLDLQGTSHQDLEKDLRIHIEKSKATMVRLQPELQEKWQVCLLKESEHETAIRRVGVEFETCPQSSGPPSLIDVRKRKDCADAQDKRTGELISDIEAKRREKQEALNRYEQWRMVEDKEAEILVGLEGLLQKTQELQRLKERLQTEA